jgi:hypothetical protein
MDALNELLALVPAPVPAPHKYSVVPDARAWAEVENQLVFNCQLITKLSVKSMGAASSLVT